jgi:hypothetical protein
MNDYTILIARVGVVDGDLKNVPMLDTVAKFFHHLLTIHK